MGALNPDKALIFRITHVDNVPWLLDHGLHCRSSPDFDPNFRSIGNPELIARRQHRVVPVPPGGTLADYVPFYFTPYSIMLYNIKTGYGGVPRLPNEAIVILVSSLRRVAELGIGFVFTDRHAYVQTASFFNSLDDLGRVDWPLLQARDFRNDPEDPGKKERYRAEALVHRLPQRRSGSALEKRGGAAQSVVADRGAARLVFLNMITFRQGNLLEADVEAVVNTVNTVGVMGKGIALMFKERYPENFRAYAQACKAGEVRIGRMFVTATGELSGPRWIINFPTKEDWRKPSRLQWIEAGLQDLVRVIREKGIRSLALPPLGCGNGGLDWNDVRPLIERALAQVPEVRVIAFEPTPRYQNVAKRRGVEKLTVPRALMAEAIRRYWVLGIECTLLEIHKLAWFLSRAIHRRGLPDVLDLRFEANRYGPYSRRLNHLLDGLDGSYLRADKRVADCTPSDTIAFADEKADKVAVFLRSGEARDYLPVLEDVDRWIDGFQSPLGMELLATVDWLLVREGCAPEVSAVRQALARWPGGPDAGQRKTRLFEDQHLAAAIERLRPLAS